MGGSSQNILIAGVVTAVAACTAVLYLLTRPPAVERKRASGSGSGKAMDSKAKSEEELQLDLKKLLAIFHDITTRMQHVVMRLAQEEQRVAQQRAQRGQPPNAQEIQRYLIARFQEAMGEIETQVYGKYNTNEEQVRAAVDFYEDDKELVKAVYTLKSLYNAVMGHQQDLPEVPEHITMQKVLQVLEGTMELLRSTAQEIRDELAGSGVDQHTSPQEFSMQFQPLYAAAIEKARAKLLKDNGIEQDTVLQAAVVKYQQYEEFTVALKKLTEEHNAKMHELGFGVSGQ
mmetsp:Transcript_10413/g.13005  ORF Transcript_10413/g.13005 Transcript_10413/m.13005 type:complete len:287 (-) Transcript_10413:1697-2557(-)|eukprot:CAMPEP_0204826208 /NCGR_PEP_ID=MMETSP1346-20131115/3943_1 /ASSEMBLY_ACC=CAM_ASM_000771 /TAXON_ID=215587 /ORGANISM="Aplanochytrium stocchinoi, Strain GSBS06" /LENGTH=286 /DNA_ID=CAMNT_0051954123 /DNA_START=245 /DNA_END=1105 /DNA_ORIENTATION=+